MKKQKFWVTTSLSLLLFGAFANPLALADTLNTSVSTSEISSDATDTSVSTSEISSDATDTSVSTSEISSDATDTSSSTDNLSNAKEKSSTTSQEKNEKSNLATTDSIVIGNWGSATYKFDSDTGIITVHDGILAGAADYSNTNRPVGIDVNKIKSVIFGENIEFAANMVNFFNGSIYLNLESVSGSPNTSNVTDMSYMFSGCANLTTLDISKWDTSNKNLSSMLLSTIKLKNLTLGEKSIFNDDPMLTKINKGDPRLTGQWINTNDGNIYSSSQNFTDTYDGTHPGTYIWEEFEPFIGVKDVTIHVGDSWKINDNFISAGDYYDHSLGLTDLEIVGIESVNNNKVGKYKLTFKFCVPIIPPEGSAFLVSLPITSDESPVVTSLSITSEGDKICVYEEAYVTVVDTEEPTDSEEPTVTIVNNNTQSKANTLPKTGDSNSPMLTILGTMTLLAGVVYVLVLKRKNN